jgi:hypothetical protein
METNSTGGTGRWPRLLIRLWRMSLSESRLFLQETGQKSPIEEVEVHPAQLLVKSLDSDPM